MRGKAVRDIIISDLGFGLLMVSENDINGNMWEGKANSWLAHPEREEEIQRHPQDLVNPLFKSTAAVFMFLALFFLRGMVFFGAIHM